MSGGLRMMLRSGYLLLMAMLLYSCAIQVAPQGGDRDTRPPKLIRAEPADRTTGFHGNTIRLDFDEYVQLKDAATQFVVSPPLTRPPLIKARKKSILVTWEDTLHDATTYTFSFGNCIVDNNEANPVTDYQMVLSTGTVIDSLTFEGAVVDAYDDSPVSGALVMLYSSFPDAVPIESLPANFARTGSDGRFRINNVSPGNYFVLAVMDQNGNYRYDGGEEKVAFTDSLVAAPATAIRLRLFRETPEPQLIRGFSVAAGKAVFAFTASAPDARWEWITDSAYLQPSVWEWNSQQDSLTLWYRNQAADSMVIRFLQNERIDTADFRLFRKTEKAQHVAKRFGAADFSVISFVNGNQQRSKPLALEFDVPQDRIDTTKILCSVDSVPSRFTCQWEDSIHRRLLIFQEWVDDKLYRFEFLQGAFTDLFGKGSDSSAVEFKVRSEREYASVRFDLRQQQPGAPRLLQLVNDRSELVREVAIQRDTAVTWSLLEPGLYKVKLVDDKNRNGRWDTGNLIRRLQPEPTRFAPESVPLRANWDADLRWDEGK